MSEAKPFDPKLTLFDETYWGKVKHTYKKFHPKYLLYSDEEILRYDSEIKDYLLSGKTTRTNQELWDMHYACLGSLHPETGEPVPKLFRWSAFVPVNIPLIMGISVLAPTTFNQILFQSLNQLYNFGTNVSNASASNKKSDAELMISCAAAVSSAIIGSAGLRKFLVKKNIPGPLGRTLLTLTPYFGVVVASAVNLFFSRSKELFHGIPVNHPQTQEQIPAMKSRKAGGHAFLESLFLRCAIPLPLMLIPMCASKLASKSFRFYQKPAHRALFDTAVVSGSVWGGLLFIMSGGSTIGRRRLMQYEQHIRDKFKEFPDDTLIHFNKGL